MRVKIYCFHFLLVVMVLCGGAMASSGHKELINTNECDEFDVSSIRIFHVASVNQSKAKSILGGADYTLISKNDALSLVGSNFDHDRAARREIRELDDKLVFLKAHLAEIQNDGEIVTSNLMDRISRVSQEKDCAKQRSRGQTYAYLLSVAAEDWRDCSVKIRKDELSVICGSLGTQSPQISQNFLVLFVSNKINKYSIYLGGAE